MKRQTSTQTRNQGFTIIEMLIALVVLAVILSLAAPSFRDSSARTALRSTTMDLIASINNARAQAVNLGTVVTLAATDGTSWTQGWQATLPSPHDDENQDFLAKNGVTITATGGETSLNFRRDGTTSAQVTFRLCHNDLTGETGREISINRLGRTSNQEYTCP